jgi:nitroreductase
MTLEKLIKSRRTIRKYQQKPIDYDILERIVDAGRLAPSGSNLQPIEFIIVDEKAMVNEIFNHTRWAGYLPKNIGYPQEGQRPVAFIVVMINRQIKASGGEHDTGAAMENMILLALEEGIGSCWLGSIDRNEIKNALNVPEHYHIDSLLALGYPDEHPTSEPMQDSIKYYLDQNGKLHVPKRQFENIVHRNTF